MATLYSAGSTGETVWLTQQHMTELFQSTQQNVNLHIQNIYEERELERGATVKESLSVQLEGKRSVRRRVEFYNLDVIISVQEGSAGGILCACKCFSRACNCLSRACKCFSRSCKCLSRARKNLSRSCKYFSRACKYFSRACK